MEITEGNNSLTVGLEFKGTPGPWRWEVNQSLKQIQLLGGIPKFDLIVMDFVRYGMSGAAPRFNNSVQPTNLNLMVRAEEFAYPVEGREHHSSWFKNIEHPDAKLIASAPDLLKLAIALRNGRIPSLNEVDEVLNRVLS